MTVTIKQYDSSTALHNPFFDQVRGTVGDVMYVNGRPMRQVSPDAPGHTFTIQTPPDTSETNLFVNVPLLGVSDNAPNAVTIAGEQYPKPNVIVFRFRTGAPGPYVWHCYVPCGTGLAGDGIERPGRLRRPDGDDRLHGRHRDGRHDGGSHPRARGGRRRTPKVARARPAHPEAVGRCCR